jgi:hypothetical protein
MTASASAVGLQPTRESTASPATSRAPLPLAFAIHSCEGLPPALCGVSRYASQRPSCEKVGEPGTTGVDCESTVFEATSRSDPAAPSSTHNVPREMNASSP